MKMKRTRRQLCIYCFSPTTTKSGLCAVCLSELPLVQRKQLRPKLHRNEENALVDAVTLLDAQNREQSKQPA